MRSACLATPGLCVALAACAGYEATSQPLVRDLRAGRLEPALAHVNSALGVKAVEDGYIYSGPDAPLLLLERATVLQALGRYDLSSRDYQAADAHLEVLDLDGDEAGSVAKYLWSDSATLYKSPPYEKSLLNTLNLLAYLARGEVSGARVEARRLLVMDEHLKDKESNAPMLALGSYLSGFTFEQSGRYPEAMRYYGDAAERGGVPTLAEAARSLHARSGLWDKRLGPEPEAPQPLPAGPTGDLLVVVGTGRVPYRTPERVPIGIAVALLTQPNCRHCLTPAQRQQANRVSAQGLVTWLNFPSLVRARPQTTGAQVTAGGRFLPGGVGLDAEALALADFERGRPALLLASFTRAVTRALAGAGTEAAVRSAAGRKGGGDALGMLAGLVVQGVMVATDTPDTRSWTSLPGRFHVYRARVPAGTLDVRVLVEGTQPEEVVRRVEVRPGGYAVVTHFTLR